MQIPKRSGRIWGIFHGERSELREKYGLASHQSALRSGLPLRSGLLCASCSVHRHKHPHPLDLAQAARSSATDQATINSLPHTVSQIYDLAILGAGISGLGVAQAAAEGGLSTLVLEAAGTAKATSNNTLRIIHGGFRYLQKLQLSRVIQSLNDQTYVAKTFPDATKALACLMPLKSWGLKSKLPVACAALAYGSAMRALKSPLTAPKILAAKMLAEIAPQLATRAPYGALCWHDLVITNPGLLAAQLTEQIIHAGVTLLTETKVTAVTKTTNGYTIATELGEQYLARKVVNTLGPWIRSIALPQTIIDPGPRWCLGFNITTSHQIHPTHAIAVESADGRLFFAVPRGEHTTIGTWYTPCAAPSSSTTNTQPVIPSDELERFITAWNRAWPEQSITRQAVIACDSGILPMLRDSATGPVLYGAEIISTNDNYTEVLSTKYTTFRSQGRRVISPNIAR